MEIRTCRAEDEEAVVELWRSAGLIVAWNDPRKDIRRKLDEDPDSFLVAEVDGEVVGTAMAGYDGHRGGVFYFCIHPEHQGRGLGRRFMDRIEALLLRRGCPKVNVMVRGSNVQAVGFYEALGYEKSDVLCLGKRLIPD